MMIPSDTDFLETWEVSFNFVSVFVCHSVLFSSKLPSFPGGNIFEELSDIKNPG